MNIIIYFKIFEERNKEKTKVSRKKLFSFFSFGASKGTLINDEKLALNLKKLLPHLIIFELHDVY